MQIGLSNVTSGLGTAWSWWTGELRSAVPPVLVKSLAEDRPEVVLHWTGNQVDVLLRRRGAAEHLGQIDPAAASDQAAVRTVLNNMPKKTPVAVALGENYVLRQTAELPLAAEKTLRNVVGFELDRLTPFSSKDVYFDCRIVSRRPDVQKLEVDLYLATRETVDAIREICAGWGLAPVRFDMTDSPKGETMGIHLMDGPPPRPRRPLARTVCNVLLVGVLGLGGFIGWANLNAKQEAADTLKARLTALRDEVASYGALEDAANVEAARLAAVKTKSEAPLATEILDEVTRRLPERSWLIYYRLSGDRLTLSGSSDAAANLIGVFEASPLFVDAEFAEPIVQDPRSGRERFSLSLRLAEGPQS